MSLIWYLSLLLLYFDHFANGFVKNSSSRPIVVNVGALFEFNSTIGRVAKIAIEEAVKDVNSNSSILPGTKLVVDMKDSNCNLFVGVGKVIQFMETDTVAVIGPQSSIVAHFAAHAASQFQVPMLSFGATDPSISHLQFPFFVRTTHSDLYQMSAIADIINHYGWKQVIAIFIDDEYGRNGVSALDAALLERHAQVSHKLKISPGPEISREEIIDTLLKVTLWNSRVIVLHAYPNICFEVLSAAHYLGLMTEGYAWIATDWLSSILDSSLTIPSETMDTLQGVLALRQHTPDSDRKRAFFSRWKKLVGGSIGLNAYGLYAYDTVWLVAHAIDSLLNQGGIMSFSNGSRSFSAELGLQFNEMPIFEAGKLLLKNILQSNLDGLTGPIKFNPDRSLALPSYDIVNVVGIRFRKIGYWSNHSHLSNIAPEVLHSNSANLSRSNQELLGVVWPGDTLKKPRGWLFTNSGEPLRIGVPIQPAFKKCVSQVRGTDAFEGYCIDIFRAAVDLLPYALQYQFIAYGNDHEIPNYTELLKLVSTGVFDAAIADFQITSNRSKIVDFTQPFSVSGLVVAALITKSNTGAWAFLQPISLSVWGFFAVSILLVGLVLWILERRVNDEFSGSSLKQLGNILWFSLSSLFGTHRGNTVSTLGRALLIIWLFVVLILNESYTASLSSRLMVQHLSSPIKGIETLKKSADVIGYPLGTLIGQHLMDIGIPKSRLVPIASLDEFASALHRGSGNGGVDAIVDERHYMEYFLSSHCKIRIVGQAFSKGGWGFVFPRDSPLTKDVSSAIMKLSDSGDLQRIRDEWFTSTPCESESNEIQSDQLHLESFLGLYFIIGIACSVSIIIYFSKIVRQSRFAARSRSLPIAEAGSRSRDGPSTAGRSQSIQLQQLQHSVHESKNLSARSSKRRRLEN